MSTVPPLSPASSSRSGFSLDALDTNQATSISDSPTIVQPLDSAIALQIAHGEPQGLDPISGLGADDYDLVRPAEKTGASPVGKKHKLELRSELLFSTRHLEAIFNSPSQLHHFSDYLVRHRTASLPLLRYYLQALKALKAVEYSNAVVRKLGTLSGSCEESEPETEEKDESTEDIAPSINQELIGAVQKSFELMVQQDLPMYITHVWIQTVSASIRHRITSTPARQMNEGLAEVFCLTDPSRHDNPIVFMSEEFNRTTQYGVDYVVGRNCRFLQGPCTNALSVTRIREKLAKGKEHYETFLNYRRDGSPFMNLVMLAPLYDSRGTVRYFIGAQVDVSGLAMDCYGLPALKGVVNDTLSTDQDKDEFVQLVEMFGQRELDLVGARGGDMYRNIRLQTEEKKTDSTDSEGRKTPLPTYSEKTTKRVMLRDPESPTHQPTQPDAPKLPMSITTDHNGRLTGVYEHYLLIRPYPSLRILFTSPSMRIPGILQSPLLDRVGGSSKANQQLEDALANGQAVTAKVKWLNGARRKGYSNDQKELDSLDKSDKAHERENGKSRWLHCTPLLGNNGQVGVWMVVIVDADENGDQPKPIKPIKPTIAAAPTHIAKAMTATRQPSLVERNVMAQKRLPLTPRSDSKGFPKIAGPGRWTLNYARPESSLDIRGQPTPSIRSLVSNVNSPAVNNLI